MGRISDPELTFLAVASLPAFRSRTTMTGKRPVQRRVVVCLGGVGWGDNNVLGGSPRPCPSIDSVSFSRKTLLVFIGKQIVEHGSSSAPIGMAHAKPVLGGPDWQCHNKSESYS